MSRIKEPRFVFTGTSDSYTSAARLVFPVKLYFLIVIMRSAALAMTGFFVHSVFDSQGFYSFTELAPPYIWGTGYAIITLMALLSASRIVRDGRVARATLVLSASFSLMASTSFLISILHFNVGWWGCIGYLTIGLTDLLIASYPGEVS